MDNDNTNLQSQLAKLRNSKYCDCGRTIGSISSENVTMQMSAISKARTHPSSTRSELWEEESPCIRCRNLYPNPGQSPDEGKAVAGNSQLFLP